MLREWEVQSNSQSGGGVTMFDIARSRFSHRTKGWLLASLGVIALASCSFGADQHLATEAVSQFHSLYNSEDYSSIYASTDDAFKKATSEADYETFMAAIHRKLGAQKSSTSASWTVSQTLSGTQVVLTFKTEFAEGAASERFVFRTASGKASLLGYNINSPLLIIK
jgi:uncharacterized protein DUF4019